MRRHQRLESSHPHKFDGLGFFESADLHPDQPRVYGRMRALYESLLEYVMFKSSNSNEPAITTYLYVGNHAMSCRLVVIDSPLCGS